MADDSALPAFDLPSLIKHDENALLLPGDILLVSSTQKGIPRVNRMVQSIARLGRKSDFSHAALCVGAGMIAESLTGDGVRTKHILEFLEGTNIKTGKVLRPRDQGKLCNLTAVYTQANFFYGARYNWRFLLPKSAERDAGYLFCSEFIAQVFQKLGYPEFRRRAERIFPIDLVRLEREPGWQKFDLKNMLEPWVTLPHQALGEFTVLAKDPRFKDIIGDAKAHEANVARFREQMRLHAQVLIVENDTMHRVSRVFKGVTLMQVRLHGALLMKLSQCRDYAEQKAMLEKAGLWPCWAELPKMASFLEKALEPPPPQVYASEDPAATEMLRDQTVTLNLLRVHVATIELRDLVVGMERYLVYDRDVRESNNETFAEKLKLAISLMSCAHELYAAAFDRIDDISEELRLSLLRSSELIAAVPKTGAGERLFLLWKVLYQVHAGLAFVTMLKFFKPDESPTEKATMVLAIADIFEEHQHHVTALRGQNYHFGVGTEEDAENAAESARS